VTAQVEELLISPNDYLTIKALLSERQGGVSVTARIIGVERVVHVKESLIKRGASLLAVGLGGLLLGIVSVRKCLVSLMSCNQIFPIFSYVVDAGNWVRTSVANREF